MAIREYIMKCPDGSEVIVEVIISCYPPPKELIKGEEVLILKESPSPIARTNKSWQASAGTL